MRITKQVLTYRWAVFSVLAALVFAVLTWSDMCLKSLSGFGTADLQGFASCGTQHRPNFANAAPAIADMDEDRAANLLLASRLAPLLSPWAPTTSVSPEIATELPKRSLAPVFDAFNSA